ncbi:Glyco_18 protein [Blomia tropicalis]|nr:Glyco_18 protein [Blomia tropicalis]
MEKIRVQCYSYQINHGPPSANTFVTFSMGNSAKSQQQEVSFPQQSISRYTRLCQQRNGIKGFYVGDHSKTGEKCHLICADQRFLQRPFFYCCPHEYRMDYDLRLCKLYNVNQPNKVNGMLFTHHRHDSSVNVQPYFNYNNRPTIAPQRPKQIIDNLIRSCEPGVHYKSHPTKCTHYLHCTFGMVYTDQVCPMNLWWNDEMKYCDIKENSSCEKKRIQSKHSNINKNVNFIESNNLFNQNEPNKQYGIKGSKPIRCQNKWQANFYRRKYGIECGNNFSNEKGKTVFGQRKRKPFWHLGVKGVEHNYGDTKRPQIPKTTIGLRPTLRPTTTTVVVFDKTTPIEIETLVPSDHVTTTKSTIDNTISTNKFTEKELTTRIPTTVPINPSTFPNNDDTQDTTVSRAPTTLTTQNPSTLPFTSIDQITQTKEIVETTFTNKDTTITKIPNDETTTPTSATFTEIPVLPTQLPLVNTTSPIITTSTVDSTTFTLTLEENGRCLELGQRFKDPEDCQCYFECQLNRRITRNCCPEGLLFNQVEARSSSNDYNLDESEGENPVCDLPENVMCKTIIQIKS